MQQFSSWTTSSNGTEAGDTSQAPVSPEAAFAEGLDTHDTNGAELTQPGWQREVPPWEVPQTPENTGAPEDLSPLGFDEAFDVLDRQSGQLRMLRGKLGTLFEQSAERDRAMARLQQELVASRAESERERLVVADLRAELAKQDQLIRSVRETVSALGRTLDPVVESWNASRAA